jgi:hypothetical protein
VSLSELIAAEAKTLGSTCTIETIHRTLTPEDIEALNTAFATPTVTSAQIQRALVKAGHTVSGSTVRRHRAGDCTCGTR